jgi:N-acetyl-gamma-glutamyl-phosphate reductase
MRSVAIVGGTGYTGSELLRLLAHHPEARVDRITSRQAAGTPIAEWFGHLRGISSLVFETPDPAALRDHDVVFFATPNGTAMHHAPELLEAGCRVIDLAADFRLPTAERWEQWYGMPHASPELLSSAVYGLPELFRERIREARLIANPGCYPTAVLLGLAPLVEAGLTEARPVIADGKSGVSGAGRQAKTSLLMGELNENFKAYALGGHRHQAEMEAVLTRLTDGSPVEVVFQPHLVPMIRGIEVSLYTGLRASAQFDDVQQRFESRYQDEPFVEVLGPGEAPETRHVRASNRCHIGLQPRDPGRTVVISAVIDNLVKGAAGQAVQNMNILFGLPETTGLDAVAVLP